LISNSVQDKIRLAHTPEYVTFSAYRWWWWTNFLLAWSPRMATTHNSIQKSQCSTIL